MEGGPRRRSGGSFSCARPIASFRVVLSARTRSGDGEGVVTIDGAWWMKESREKA